VLRLWLHNLIAELVSNEEYKRDNIYISGINTALYDLQYVLACKLCANSLLLRNQCTQKLYVFIGSIFKKTTYHRSDKE